VREHQAADGQSVSKSRPMSTWFTHNSWQDITTFNDWLKWNW